MIFRDVLTEPHQLLAVPLASVTLCHSEIAHVGLPSLSWLLQEYDKVGSRAFRYTPTLYDPSKTWGGKTIILLKDVKLVQYHTHNSTRYTVHSRTTDIIYDASIYSRYNISIVRDTRSSYCL